MSSIVGLDVGDARVGVAVAGIQARLPRALTTIKVTDTFMADLNKVLEIEEAKSIVIGLPRDMSGNDTEQTRKVRDFGNRLATTTGLPISYQDEATTSLKAKAELEARRQDYTKADIDALSAVYILEDYLLEHND